MARRRAYRPSPIPTSGVQLPRELDPLQKRLAEHVHDLWAMRRMAQKWTWGPRRSHSAMTHPNLVPYAELAEDDKEYDRITARETLRAIVALGYRIVPPRTG